MVKLSKNLQLNLSQTHTYKNFFVRVCLYVNFKVFNFNSNGDQEKLKTTGNLYIWKVESTNY